MSKATLGVWFNGNERLFLRKREKQGRVMFEEIPNIPHYGQMQLERISSGSILKSIRSSDLKKIKIILPEKKIQKVIGDKLKKAVYACSYIRGYIKSAEQDIYNLD